MIKIASCIGQVVVELLPTDLPRLTVALVHVKTGFNFSACLGNGGVDAIDVATHIHAIRDSFLVIVFHHEVLFEEAEGHRGDVGK